jgi:hypothetical protein
MLISKVQCFEMDLVRLVISVIAPTLSRMGIKWEDKMKIIHVVPSKWGLKKGGGGGV